MGRDGSVGLATRYMLDGPRIESRLGWGARFSARIHTGPGAYPDCYAMGTGSLTSVMRPGRGVDHPPYKLPRLKKEYNYSPSGLSWPVLR